MLWEKGAKRNYVILRRFCRADHRGRIFAYGRTEVKTLTDPSLLGFKITRAFLMY